MRAPYKLISPFALTAGAPISNFRPFIGEVSFLSICVFQAAGTAKSLSSVANRIDLIAQSFPSTASAAPPQFGHSRVGMGATESASSQYFGRPEYSQRAQRTIAGTFSISRAESCIGVSWVIAV